MTFIALPHALFHLMRNIAVLVSRLSFVNSEKYASASGSNSEMIKALMSLRPSILYSSVTLLVLASSCLTAQTGVNRPAPRIREPINNSQLVRLAGNTRPEAIAANDLGKVPDDFPMDHMMLQLKRSPEQEQAVEQFIASLHDPQSPNFHKWITAAEYGRRFGLADSDVKTITNWLESQGFTVNVVYPSNMVIDFSGTAGQVATTFRTSIHRLNVGGVLHTANYSNPEIPQALAAAVAGIVSMHDFRPHHLTRTKLPQYTFTEGGQQFEAVVPADLATIYDFNPLFSKGITGKGQTIAIIEDTDLYSQGDWNTFRSTFGLGTYTTGSLTTEYPAPPSGSNNCADPGLNSDDIEAAVDVEWATAAAPGATLVLAACSDVSSFTSGLITAMQNLVNGSNPPPIMTLSYGICEPANGAGLNASLNSLYQQATAEGMSVFVAAGDEGAASCDADTANATHGISVSGFSSTPYNVAVGATDFSDTFNNTSSTYWSSTNTATYGSALSYIPEVPWNDSCANGMLATYNGYSAGYGSNGFCNSSTAQQDGFQMVVATSGGPSNCATGAPSVNAVASGTCKGYAKPSWQSGVSGIANDGVRDLPDVSMFGANGAWGHYLVICFSDESNGGVACKGAPKNWAGVGGTSVASPVMAGVQALVNQNQGGSAQGNPNYVYYALAASTPSAFHSVTQGDILVNCGAPYDCYGALGTLDYGRNGRVFDTTWAGALSASDTSFAPAYNATSNVWNFANGLGSVDVNNLVTNWGKK